jgi:hypothetical protein
MANTVYFRSIYTGITKTCVPFGHIERYLPGLIKSVLVLRVSASVLLVRKTSNQPLATCGAE